jgi:hypothetical protein
MSSFGSGSRAIATAAEIMPSEAGLRIEETKSSDDGRNLGVGKPLVEVDDSDALKEKGENTAEAAVRRMKLPKQCGRIVSFVPAVVNPAAAGAASRAEGSMGGGAETVAAGSGTVSTADNTAFIRIKLIIKATWFLFLISARKPKLPACHAAACHITSAVAAFCLNFSKRRDVGIVLGV